MGGVRKLGPVALAGLVVTVGLALRPGAAQATTLATFSARGSVEQVYVTHAPPGATLTLEDPTHAAVATGTVDDLGSSLFRNVAPGANYTVVDGDQVAFPFDVTGGRRHAAAIVLRRAATSATASNTSRRATVRS